MSYRLHKFASLETHAWFSRIWARCKPAELEYARAFITNNDALDHGEFELATNRMFLDRPELREQYRGWKLILELVSCANTGYSRVPSSGSSA